MFCKIGLFIVILLQLICINNVQAKSNNGQSSILVEMNSGRILYQNNIHERKLIASTTKIMTAIITIENASLKEKVTVGQEVLKMYGTNIYIQVGEIMTIEDLLYGLMLRSGNDAAVVLATYIGGTEDKFVEMMNQKAKELGMEHTHFQNSHGLDDYTENYSTAYDMALLSTYAYKNKTYQKISNTKKYSTTTDDKSYIWYNRNKLLTQYEYCTGGKNGYTPKAGKTLVTTAVKDGMALTAVSINTNDEYNYHQAQYSNAFNKYKVYKIIDPKTFRFSKDIYNKKFIVKKTFSYPLTKQELKNISTEVIIYPEKQNDSIGHINIKLNQDKIGMIEIYEANTKKEDSSIFQKVSNYLFDILKKLILGRQNSRTPEPLVPIPPET